MSEKSLDFRKETQGEINCILLSKMNALKGIFCEKSCRSSFYLALVVYKLEFDAKSRGRSVHIYNVFRGGILRWWTSGIAGGLGRQGIGFSPR